MTTAIRDYLEPSDAREGGSSGPYVPMLCHDCGRPAYYDRADDQYHHAMDAGAGCFLIPGEDRADDEDHPLYVNRGE